MMRKFKHSLIGELVWGMNDLKLEVRAAGNNSLCQYQLTQLCCVDEITEVRTSSHAWCTDECYDDATVKTIRQRIFDVTGVPSNNYECLQLLKYNVGQFYRAHDDAITVHNEQSHGPRLLTFFIYFNEVEKGGGTRFPNLHDMTITPKKGRVLIWPSILDDGSWEPDIRTTHEALEVEAGFKFSANAWIHMRDFQTPFSMGCPG